MKSSIILYFIFFAFFLTHCRKSDNPRIPNLSRFPIPLLTLDAASDTRISGITPEIFHAVFSIDIYYKNGEYPRQMDLVVVKNGDVSNVKTVLPNIRSWPTTFEITGQELIDYFNEPIQTGDYFEFSTDIVTVNGTMIAAFPLGGGAPFSAGVYNLPGSSLLLRFAAPCVFNAEKYQGDFVVERDDWGDYQPDDDIAVTLINDTLMSFKYKADEALPIIMKINPQTNAVTIEKQLYGKYVGDDYFAESIPGEDSSVDPCTTSISVNINHSTAFGMFDGVIVMTKK